MEKAKKNLALQSKKAKAGKPKIVTKIDDNYGRRKWDVIGKLNNDTNPKEDELILVNERTENLKSRAHELDLNKNVGRSFIIGKDLEKGKKRIFYCEVCETNFNDSMSYVDHLNGKKHNRILGMNMKVERVTADTIISKLMKPVKVIEKSFQELKQEEEKEESEEVEAEDEEIEYEEEDDIDDEDREAMLAMGIPLSFGTTKRY